jgi:hypothetical protein
MSTDVTSDQGNISLPGPDLASLAMSRDALAADLVTVDQMGGLSADMVTVDTLAGVPQIGQFYSTESRLLALGIRAVGALVAANHGRLRHGTDGGAVGWGLAGFVFPITANLIAVFQGYGQRAPRPTSRRFAGIEAELASNYRKASATELRIDTKFF